MSNALTEIPKWIENNELKQKFQKISEMWMEGTSKNPKEQQEFATSMTSYFGACKCLTVQSSAARRH